MEQFVLGAIIDALCEGVPGFRQSQHTKSNTTSSQETQESSATHTAMSRAAADSKPVLSIRTMASLTQMTAFQEASSVALCVITSTTACLRAACMQSFQ